MSVLANQIAVVTGAGRGIGRAIALKFAGAGADVVCVSRTAENSEKVAAEVRALGRKAWAVALDVSDSKAVAAAGEKILADAGRVERWSLKCPSVEQEAGQICHRHGRGWRRSVAPRRSAAQRACRLLRDGVEDEHRGEECRGTAK